MIRSFFMVRTAHGIKHETDEKLGVLSGGEIGFVSHYGGSLKVAIENYFFRIHRFLQQLYESFP